MRLGFAERELMTMPLRRLTFWWKQLVALDADGDDEEDENGT